MQCRRDGEVKGKSEDGDSGEAPPPYIPARFTSTEQTESICARKRTSTTELSCFAQTRKRGEQRNVQKEADENSIGFKMNSAIGGGLSQLVFELHNFYD